MFCQVCKKAWCPKCRVPYHLNETCEAYLEKMIDDPVFELIRRQFWNRCPKCGAPIEKDDSKYETCNHMTCRCKNEFCYYCGKNYAESIDGK